MNSSEINSLKNSYDGKKTFQSKAAGYEFDLFSDSWTLGYKKTVYLDWMNTLDSNVYLDLRLALAHAVKQYAPSSIITQVSILKTLCYFLEPATFEAWWRTLTSYKEKIKNILYILCKQSNEYRLRNPHKWSR